MTQVRQTSPPGLEEYNPFADGKSVSTWIFAFSSSEVKDQVGPPELLSRYLSLRLYLFFQLCNTSCENHIPLKLYSAE